MEQELIKEETMPKSLMEKFKYFWGFESEEDEMLDEYELEAEQKSSAEAQPIANDKPSLFSNTKPKNKVVNIHSSMTFKIEVFEPRTFEEAVEVVECLRAKRPVVINLEEVDAELARKVFDFLSGALCAIDGKAEKISKSIFLMAPNNVQISAAKHSLYDSSKEALSKDSVLPKFSLRD